MSLVRRTIIKGSTGSVGQGLCEYPGGWGSQQYSMSGAPYLRMVNQRPWGEHLYGDADEGSVDLSLCLCLPEVAG